MMTFSTKEIIDRIFKAPDIKYELTEFETLGKAIHDILHIYPKTVETGRDAGKTKYYLKSFVPFSSGDENQAQEHRKDKLIEFRKALDPDITYDRINALFKRASEEWPGIFREGEDIGLAKSHLQVCVGPVEGVRLMGSNLRIMDDAFEYLLATQAKKKKGQFFTPRHVEEAADMERS